MCNQNMRVTEADGMKQYRWTFEVRYKLLRSKIRQIYTNKYILFFKQITQAVNNNCKTDAIILNVLLKDNIIMRTMKTSFKNYFYLRLGRKNNKSCIYYEQSFIIFYRSVINNSELLYTKIQNIIKWIYKQYSIIVTIVICLFNSSNYKQTSIQ